MENEHTNQQPTVTDTTADPPATPPAVVVEHNPDENFVKPTKVSQLFDQHIAKYEAIFLEAYDHVMANVRKELQNAENFVHFVVCAMEALKDADLHGWQKKELVIDIVHKVVDGMAIPDDEKQTIRERFFPTIEGIIDIVVAAAKGYLYLKHESLELMQDAEEAFSMCAGRGCFPRRQRRRQHRNQTKLRTPIVDEHLDLTAMVDEVYDIVKTVIRHKEISIPNLVSIGSIVMQIVEEYPQLMGYQKKHLVLRVVHRLIDEAGLDEDSKAALHFACDTALDKAIDFIIKASRGEIEIVNKITEAVEGCFQRCC